MDNTTQFSGGDPYLQFQPTFAFTFPIQLLLSGITLTLLVMLLIHLLFTTQYHYPLAPLNYCLQLSSIIAVLLGVSVRIGLILHQAAQRADQWPYGLDYISTPVPGDEWNTGEEAAWYLLQAICNGLANITHIQFLTLLYPSRTEARLIFLALGPLAVAASALYFTRLSSSITVIDLGDAIRNVFTSCLLLIFSLSLCIWGFLVNRRRAWRLDGGTGVFGAGALILAFVTTASSFVAVKEEGIDWLHDLIWAAVLWQTWLGWWWWVGAGMGIGEVEDLMERALRKRRKAARRAHRQDVINGASANRRHQTSMAGMAKAAGNAAVGFASGVSSFLPSGGGSNNGSAASGDGTGTRRRRRTSLRMGLYRHQDEGNDPAHDNAHEAGSGSGAHEDIELGSLRLREPEDHEHGARTDGSGGRQPQSSNSETSSTSATPSLHPPKTMGELVSFPATWLQVYLRKLRRAHVEAARKRAVEQAERRARVPAIAGTGGAGPALDDGWGLGAFGVREAQESTRRLQEANRQIREGQLLGEDDDGADQAEGSGTTAVEHPDDDDDDAPIERAGTRTNSRDRSERRVRIHTGRAGRDSEWEDVDSDSTNDDPEIDAALADLQALGLDRDLDLDLDDIEQNRGGPSTPRLAAPAQRSARSQRSQRSQPASGTTTPRADRAGPSAQRPAGSGWSWWGPLKEWRLEDRSNY